MDSVVFGPSSVYLGNNMEQGRGRDGEEGRERGGYVLSYRPRQEEVFMRCGNGESVYSRYTCFGSCPHTYFWMFLACSQGGGGGGGHACIGGLLG